MINVLSFKRQSNELFDKLKCCLSQKHEQLQLNCTDLFSNDRFKRQKIELRRIENGVVEESGNVAAFVCYDYWTEHEQFLNQHFMHENISVKERKD